MNNTNIRDYKRNLWVQRKLHSLVIDGYQIVHAHVQVEPSVYVWVLRHRNGHELLIRQRQNVVSMERNDKVIHIEQF